MYYSIQPIKDWALFIMVAVIVSVDIVLLITITIDRWRLRLERILLIRSVSTIIFGCSMNSEDIVMHGHSPSPPLIDIFRTDYVRFIN